MSEAITRPGATNLVHKLLDELERVIVLRERYRAAAAPGTPGVCFAPAIALMTHSIDAAKAAIGGDDVIASLRALHDLETYADG